MVSGERDRRGVLKFHILLNLHREEGSPPVPMNEFRTEREKENILKRTRYDKKS